MINHEHGKYRYFIHKNENTWACFDASFTGLVSNKILYKKQLSRWRVKCFCQEADLQDTGDRRLL